MNDESNFTDVQSDLAMDLSQMVTPAFIALSTDIRTPLTLIAGMTSVLIDGISGPLTPQQRENLLAIESATQQLRQTMDLLFETAKKGNA